MGYEEVHIEYSTAPLLPTFPRGTPSDQPSVDSAADAAPPPPPRRPTSRRRAALCEDHRSSTFAQRSREALLYSLQSLLNTLDRKNCIISDILISQCCRFRVWLQLKTVTGYRESSNSTVFGTQKKTVLMEIRTIRGVFMILIGKTGIYEIISPLFSSNVVL